MTVQGGMEKEELMELNWHTMTLDEQALWVHSFVFSVDVSDSSKTFEPLSLDLLSRAENRLDVKSKSLYIENITNEISAKTYKGLNDDQINSPDTANKFYFNLLSASIDIRAVCLYRSVRGEHV